MNTSEQRSASRHEKDYEPFGEEWEKELLKTPKKFIIELYRVSCQKRQILESNIDDLNMVIDYQHGQPDELSKAQERIRELEDWIISLRYDELIMVHRKGILEYANRLYNSRT